jgi:hypothetical protein
MKEESFMPPYFQFPVFLMELPISQTARITYMILYDRARLSQKNGWVDEEGRVYFVFPIKEICKNVGRGESAIKQALNDLEMAGLLVRKRGGFGNANRLYLRIPFSILDGKTTSISLDNQLSNSRKTELTTGGLTTPNKVIETSNNKQSNRIGVGSSFTNNFGRRLKPSLPDYSCMEGESL